jgi:hypothetical protein
MSRLLSFGSAIEQPSSRFPQGVGLDKGERYWQSDLYQDDPNEWGFAVSHGDLSIFTSWEDADSKITLGLHGDNFEVHLGIDYESKKLQAFAAAIRDKKTLDEL